MNKIKGIIKGTPVYPDLENLEVTPTREDQNFKSSKYGYSEVKVKGIDSEELNITPKTREQNFNGMYHKVNVKGDTDLIPENIRKDVEIFGVVGNVTEIPKPNVFVQEEEPTTKEGIWLQASGLDYNNIIAKEQFVAGEENWEVEDYFPLSDDFWQGGSVAIGTDIYMFGGLYHHNTGATYGTEKAYKYDTITGTITRLTDMPESKMFPAVCAIGTDIFITAGAYSYGGNRQSFKYDTLANTYTRMSDTPISGAKQRYPISSIGTDIFIFLGGTLYKWDTVADTWTLCVEFGSSASANGEMVAIGTKIYMFYNDITRVYDSTINSSQRVTPIPYTFAHGGLALNGTDIYLFGGTNAPTVCYKYNTVADTYEQLPDIPYSFTEGNACTVGKEIYLLGGLNSQRKVHRLLITEEVYPDNSLLLLTNTGGYETQLIPSSIEGRITTRILDAWHYTLENGVDETIPTYYGNGSEWVKFKN